MRSVQDSALLYFFEYRLKTEATVPDLVKILYFTYFLIVTLRLNNSLLAVHFIGCHRSQSNLKIILQLFSAFLLLLHQLSFTNFLSLACTSAYSL